MYFHKKAYSMASYDAIRSVKDFSSPASKTKK